MKRLTYTRAYVDRLHVQLSREQKTVRELRARLEARETHYSVAEKMVAERSAEIAKWKAEVGDLRVRLGQAEKRADAAVRRGAATGRQAHHLLETIRQLTSAVERGRGVE